MRGTEAKDGALPCVNLEQIEQTLLASIKLMRKGRREMERMRRKPRSDNSGHGRTAA